MTRARTAALLFAGAHTVAGVVGVAAPELFGRPWLGDAAHAPGTRAAVRGLAACDTLPALLTVDAVLRGRPLRARLAAGIASDVARIAAALTARGVGPRAGTAATVLASGAGAALAIALLPHVDDRRAGKAPPGTSGS